MLSTLRAAGGCKGTSLLASHIDLCPLVVADGAAASTTSANTTEHLSSRMVYQYYSQRLTSEQHVFMQRVVNECYLRTKPESRPIIDPNHLIYQFSRKFRSIHLSEIAPTRCINPNILSLIGNSFILFLGWIVFV